jgi:hypothetical protein
LTSYGKKLDDFYRRLGNHGLLFAMFAGALCLHIIFALGMSVPSVSPDEFQTAAWSAYFSGYADSASGSGWLTGILYTPFYFLIDNPVVRYRCMLILNGVFAALIPLLTYKIAASLGLQKAWQRTLCAVVTGVGASAFAYTKFIWSETLCVFLPFLLFWLLTKTSGTKNRFLKFLLSVFTALVLAFAPAADPRLWALVLSFLLSVIFARLFLRAKPVSFAGFLPASAIFAALQMYTGEQLNAASGFSESAGLFSLSPQEYMQAFLGQLYYFAVSTWGIGVLGICLCIALFTKLSAKTENKLLVVFAFFALAYNTLTLLMSAYGAASSLAFYQGFYIYGRYIDSASPLLLILALCYIFIHGLDFKKLMFCTISLSVIFRLFFTLVLPESFILAVHSKQGFSPVRLGTGIDAALTSDSLLFAASAVFCFVALLFVFVCCAERYRKHIISLCLCLTVLYGGLHTALFYLPHEINRAERVNAAAYSVSEHIYNSADAPPTYILERPDLAPILRFLNRNTHIGTAGTIDEFPADCFIIANPERIADFGDYVVVLAETEELIFAAMGERAEAYALSQEID